MRKRVKGWAANWQLTRTGIRGIPHGMKKLLVLAIAAAASVAGLRAQTELGYWDLNGTLARSSGTSGTLGAELLILGAGFINYGTGTTVNLQPGFTAGSSLRFFDLISIAETGRVTISNLDFSGLTTPTVSFAIRSNPAFTLSDDFRLQYDSGGGWTTADVLALPTTSYELVSYTFDPGVIDGLSDVDLRLSFTSVATLLDTVEVDNIRVTAVPEPSVVWLLVAAGGALGALRLRRRPHSAQ